MEEQLFIAEGIKIVEEILASIPELVVWVVVTDKALPFLHSKLDTSNYLLAKTDEMERISCLNTPSVALAVVRIPNQKKIADKEKTLLLDGIQDPGNLGTIIRTADWFGINQIVCSENCAEWWNPKTIQASMGSFLRINGLYTELTNFLSDIKTPISGTLLKGIPSYQSDWKKAQHIIMGSEGKGISEEVKPFISQAVTISGLGSAESLNVGVATGIMLYEWTKDI